MTEASRPGPGARAFKAPTDAVVTRVEDDSRLMLVVCAEPAAKRSQRLVLFAFGIFGLVALGAIAVNLSLALPAVIVALVLFACGAWLAQLAGQRSTFVVDGPTLMVRGWRGGAVRSSPKDVRDLRIEVRGASVTEGRPRTTFDLTIALDDGSRHTVKTQFARHEYAEETVEALRGAIRRAGGRV